MRSFLEVTISGLFCFIFEIICEDDKNLDDVKKVFQRLFRIREIKFRELDSEFSEKVVQLTVNQYYPLFRNRVGDIYMVVDEHDLDPVLEQRFKKFCALNA